MDVSRESTYPVSLIGGRFVVRIEVDEYTGTRECSGMDWWAVDIAVGMVSLSVGVGEQHENSRLADRWAYIAGGSYHALTFDR